MNKNASAPLVIGGISVGAIILLLFRFWATNLVIDALEPEFEKVLNQLNEKVVCIPEASSQNHEICINNLGEVIINGNLEKPISISTDSGDFCNINSGQYNYDNICILNNLNKASQIYVDGMQAQKTIIEAAKIAGYINNLQNLKRPIKTGVWLWKKVRYIPI